MEAQNTSSATPVEASTDSPDSAKSEQISTMSKDLSEAFAKFMIWTFTILATKATDAGNALPVKHNGFLMAAVLVSFVNLLLFVLATVLQLDTETRTLIVELVLGSSVTILASFVISWAIGWVILSLWLCVFAILALLIIKNTV